MGKSQEASIQFVVCLSNKGYQASLEVGKLYRMLPDEEAAKHGLVRVIDESGQDYAFEAGRFYALAVPREVEQALRTV